MRIFKAFIVIMATIILFLFPLTEAMYDFQTDLQTDTFTSSTDPADTSETVTLSEEIYDDDTTTVGVSSSLSTDVPLFSSYNTTTRSTVFTGLTDNATRTLTVTYDVDALEGWSGIENLTGRLAWIWLLMCIAFPICGLTAIFKGWV